MPRPEKKEKEQCAPGTVGGEPWDCECHQGHGQSERAGNFRKPRRENGKQAADRKLVGVNGQTAVQSVMHVKGIESGPKRRCQSKCAKQNRGLVTTPFF